MLNTVKKYASLVTFSHTVFAMPFALVGFFIAVRLGGGEFDLLLLLKVVLCMVFARNAAMAFNRYADRRIDAENPRTAARDIPSGRITPRAALFFTLFNAALFVVTAGLINMLCLKLSPVALAVILGYTLTKRVSYFCHIFIGLALSIAPVAAYVAVTGQFAVLPLLLAVLVLTWVSGFDVIYSLQDAEFDREHGVFSIPSRFGIRRALVFSSFLHLLTIGAVIVIGMYYQGGVFYKIGSLLFIVLLVYQHVIVTPKNLSRVNRAFGTTNGIASIIYGLFFIISLYF